MKNSSPLRGLSIVSLCIVFFVGSQLLDQQGYGLNMTNVSVTVSNPRPSFRGAIGSAIVGTSSITLDTTANEYPSSSSAQLVQGDVLAVGEGASLGSYTVASSSSDAIVNLTTVLAAGDADTGDDVISTQSSSLTVHFTTVSAVNNGKFRILVPAHATDATSSDGIPDSGFFDYSFAGPTVTCPSSITNYTFGAATQAASGVTLNGLDYHSFVCPYTGTGAVGTAFDDATNEGMDIASLINPAPKTNHVFGTAEAYTVIVQHLSASDVVIDQTATKIGVIEAVKVTATVDPTISFKIIGEDDGKAACGFAGGSDVNTTATTVPFGVLDISGFTTAVQTLSVSTNAANGYAVTAVANDQMGRNGATCLGDNVGTNCIRDSEGDSAAMEYNVSDEWVTTTNKGFGFSLHDSNSLVTEAFAYNTATGNCSGTFCARQFADAEDSQSATSIFSDTVPSDNDNLMVCYQVIPAVTTAAGNYENYITYTATATF